jgi:2,5-diketo-D-gluconate reductase A
MRENIDIFGFELTDDEMTRVAAMDRGESGFFDHRDPAMVSQLCNRRID